MNNANPYEMIHAPQGAPPPLVINLVVHPRREEFVGGVPATSTRVESYILLSALPEELRQRVTTAIEALQAGM